MLEIRKLVAVESRQPNANAAGGIASDLASVPGFVARVVYTFISAMYVLIPDAPTEPGRVSTFKTPRMSGSSSVSIRPWPHTPSLMLFCAAWEPTEPRDASGGNEAKSALTLQQISRVATDVVCTTYVSFSGDIFPVLNAPFTEFAAWTLREDADRAKFQEDLPALHEQLKREISSEDIIDGGWGASMEDQNQFIGGVGWYDLEVRARLLYFWHSLMDQLGSASRPPSLPHFSYVNRCGRWKINMENTQ